mgnify:CR=1 FL=1
MATYKKQTSSTEAPIMMSPAGIKRAQSQAGRGTNRNAGYIGSRAVAATNTSRPAGKEIAGMQAVAGVAPTNVEAPSGLNVGFLNALGMARDLFFGKPKKNK